MVRLRTYAAALGAAAATVGVAVARHGRGAATSQPAAGGILIGDAVAYDALTRLVFGSLCRGGAADVAAVGRIAGVDRRVVRRGRQHAVDAPVGRPDRGVGRDRPSAASCRRPPSHELLAP